VLEEPKFDDELKNLVKIGKKKGYLLYDELNEHIPAEIISSSDDIDDLFTMFDKLGIELVDTEDEYNSIKENIIPQKYQEDIIPKEEEQDQAQSTDSIRMYLKEMGIVPLLSRDGEIDIAKQIEKHQQKLLKAVSSTPLAIKELVLIGKKIRKNKKFLSSIIDLEEEGDTAKIIDEKYKLVLDTIDKIEALSKEIDALKNEIENKKEDKTNKISNPQFKLIKSRIKIAKLIQALGLKNDVKRKIIHNTDEYVKKMNALIPLYIY
jgi:RNA polymerase primary sigma factor